MTRRFLFATGIENSSPTINGGCTRIDQCALNGHYDRWQEDFHATLALGIRVLRYGVPLYRTYVAPERFDWSFTDMAFAELRRLAIVPIVDLCHFGVPDWIGNFQNPDFPALFAAYAKAFALRYPHLQLYTPVNEIMICALFSARLGWWNEQLTDERSFVTALKHLAKANVLAMSAIHSVTADAIFIQSESSEYYHAVCPTVEDLTGFLNERRFLSLDLNYGVDVSARMYQYLRDNGMTQEEYRYFMEPRSHSNRVMGNDYYVTNEHRVTAAREICTCGEVFGYDEITQQYFNRYQLPVMHTETNYAEGEDGQGATDWLWKQWANVMCVRSHGVPVIGFTWYSLTDQIDWDSALREQNGRVNDLGLYDLDRRLRPVGRAYQELISVWRDRLPSDHLVPYPHIN